MVNRVLQAKDMKRKRQRRLFPKSYSTDYIPVGKPPVRQVIREYKMRAKSLAFDADYLAQLEAKTRFKGVPPGRVEAFTRFYDELTKAETVSFVNLRPRHPFYQTLMFFNSERTFYIIYEEDFRRATVSCSTRYQFRANLIEDWKRDKVRWASVAPLHQGPPPDQLAAPPS